MNDIRVGTSGYSFKDWVGTFYPPEIKKGKMLDYYKNFFNTVEINSTYYKMSNPFVMYHLSKKTPDHFDFMVKANQEVTHKRQLSDQHFEEFFKSIEPLRKDQKLSGFLAQFPYSFKYNQQSADYIHQLKDYFDQEPLFIEFRHHSWKNDKIMEQLRKDNMGYVVVDAPDIKQLYPFHPDMTNSILYFRLHGRNKENWWATDGRDRYDYNYSEEEINQLTEKISSLLKQAQKSYIFFNNCHAGQAVKNAQLLKQILNLDL